MEAIIAFVAVLAVTTASGMFLSSQQEMIVKSLKDDLSLWDHLRVAILVAIGATACVVMAAYATSIYAKWMLGI